MSEQSQKTVKKLSAAKQKLSLGQVKKSENATNSRKVVRSTVVNPDYLEWPFISEGDEKELLDYLTLDLKALNFPSYHVPLSVIAKIEQGDRRNHRHIYHTQRALEVGFDVANYTKLRGDLSLGANCVSTGLEQGVIKAVIIDRDVDPPIISKLLVPIARSKGVPIVAISGLSKTCKTVFRTRCIAMGFKNNCCDDFSHRFHRIYKMVSSIAKKELQVNSSALSLVHSIQDIAAPQLPPKAINSSNMSDDAKKEEARKRGPNSNPDSFKPPKIRKV